MSIIVDGTDTKAQHGLVVTSRSGWHDSVAFEHQIERVPGREDWVDLSGGVTLTRPRTVECEGHVSADSKAGLITNLRNLHALMVEPAQITFAFPDDPDIEADGNCLRLVYDEIPPVYSQTATRCAFVIECKDPRRYDTSSGSRVALP